jgi:hypothetical protein
MGEMRNYIKIVVRIREGKREFGIPRRKWTDHMSVEFADIACEYLV